ncbi:MAG: histidine kinase [Chitinophagaceae bacterium]|nr:histidine kinase [Chitinophagaceae bacterium]
MIRQWLNWRSLLALVAIIIVIATIFYSRYLANKIAKEETQKVALWVEAQKTILNSPDTLGQNLAYKIIAENDDIPIIETNEKDSLTYNFLNLDSTKVQTDSNFLRSRFREFKSLHKPILLIVSEKPYLANRYYYGESNLQKQLRYYPIVQLFIVGLFISIMIIAQASSYRSLQNKMWAGMAKETAHQLGTPITSLQGWVEILKDVPANEKLVPEIEKDVMRLQLISDRFGKIGSQPQLEIKDITQQVSQMVAYMRKRAGHHMQMEMITNEKPAIVKVSPPLFDWVIENLIKNALDSMEGKGKISVIIKELGEDICIDVKDTGKGIPRSNWNKVFQPGFSTKKRGWGLGLTLSKRIVEQYHKGQLFIKSSDADHGTTFRILLQKNNSPHEHIEA